MKSSFVASGTNLQISVHNPIIVAVVYAFQNLLDAVRCVSLAVEFSSNDILEEFAAGNSAGSHE